MTIRKKILFWFLVPSILIATVTSVFSYYYTREALKENIFNQLEMAANELEKRVNVFLQEKKRRIHDFGFDDFVRKCTEEITQKEDRKNFYTTALNKHLEMNKKPLASNIYEVFIVDLEGEIIASTDANHMGEDVSSKKYFKEAVILDAYVDDPHHDIHLEETVIEISTVLLSKAERESIGVMVNRIRVEYDEDGTKIGTPAEKDYKEKYSQLLAVNKARIIDFGSDGFIRDCTEEITRRDDRVKYYTTALNEHLIINKQPLDPDILTTFIVDFTGKIVGSSEIGLLGKDVSGDDYFLKTKKRGACIIDLHSSPGLIQNTFEAARLLLSIGGKKPIGVIVNRYKGDSLEKITLGSISQEFDRVKVLEGFGKTGELYIVNRGNLMITKSKFIDDAILKQIVDTEGVQAAFDNGEGVIGVYNDFRGVRVLGVYRYVEDMDWVLVAEKEVSEAFASLVRIRNFIIIMGLTGIAVIIAIAIFISGEITRRINKLIEGTKRIAGGNLKRPIVLGKRQDEIKALSESFNVMMDNLRISNENNARLLLEIEERGKDEWQKTFDVITDIITIHDKDYRIVNANKAFLEKFNISAEELSDRKCYEIFHGTSEPWPTCPLARTAVSLKPEHIEIDDPNMGGTFIVSTYPIFDEKGEFCGAVHQGKDITEWKKAEEEIRIGKEYTESLIETAQDAIVCVDENGVVNIWNQAAYRIFGYKENQIIGSSIKNIIPVNILDGFLEMSKIIRISRVLEVSGKTRDGRVIPLEMSVSSQKIEKGRHVFTMIIRDITFQREAKKQLVEKANMLATVNKELEEFVYIVSHDLKEPLFVIEGFTSRLYRAYKDVYDDKEKHYIDRIKTNVKKMSQKIQEIMEVLKAGRIAYNFRENDTDTIVKEIVSSLEDRIKTNKINVLIEHNLPAVFCDEKRMKDVFSNLVTNAIKFMGNGKQAETLRNPLTKEQSNGDYGVIRIGCHKNEDYYKFFVEDSGIGIRKEYQERVFKIFKRLQDIEAEGTGVGLAIVKKIVELHGGKLWVESPLKDGRGSRFCFTIPLEKIVSGQHDMQGDVDLPLGVLPGTSIEVDHGIVSPTVACRLSPVA